MTNTAWCTRADTLSKVEANVISILENGLPFCLFQRYMQLDMNYLSDWEAPNFLSTVIMLGWTDDGTCSSESTKASDTAMAVFFYNSIRCKLSV